MATLQRPSLPNGQFKGDVVTAKDEPERGSFAWVRRVVEKFRSSRKTQIQTIQYFGSQVVELSSQSAEDKVHNILDTDMFFGMRHAIPVPPEARAVFDERVVHRLRKDLDQAWKAIEPISTSRYRNPRTPNQFISELVELRMSGRATGGENGRVVLAPTIWVRCPKWQMARMQKALDATCMKWAHETEFGRIMVGDAAKLGSTDASSDPYEIPVGRGIALDQDGLEGVTLHLEVEDVSTRRSVEGIYCRATLVKGGMVRSQKLSTIGGVLNVGGRPFGVTSAHGILGNLWDAVWMEGDLLPGGDAIADETFGHDRSSPEDSNNVASSGGSSDNDDFSCYAKFATKPPQPSTATPRKWIEVELGDVANFLGLKAIVVKGDGVPSTVVFIKDTLKSDFALVRLDGILKHLGPGQRALSTSVVGYDGSETIAPGPVLIRLGDGEVGGIVLAHPASLEIFGVSMPTQYVQLSQTLSLGSSGAWVVRDNVLCGMIIAVYDYEPYAHMVPASRFVGDIKNSTPDTPSITAFKGSLAKYFLENVTTSASPSTTQEHSLPPQDTPTPPDVTIVTPAHVTAPRPLRPAVRPLPRANDVSPEFEATQHRAHAARKRINHLRVLQRWVVPSSLQKIRAPPTHFTSLDREMTNSGLYSGHLDDERYEENSPPEQIVAYICKELDTQGFNRPLALLAALEYFASWYNLFAINLATSSLDFVYSDSETPENGGLGSGVLSSLPVLVGMSMGMFAGGQLATIYGSSNISPLFLTVLLCGNIAMLATASQRNTSLIVVWQVIAGLGIGSCSLLPSVAVVECSSTKTRSAMLALLLSMQGLAQLCVHGLGALLLSVSLRREPKNTFDTDKSAVNLTWLIVTGLGALPVAAAIFLHTCTDIPESPRFMLAARARPQLAEKAVLSLKHSSTRKLFFAWRSWSTPPQNTTVNKRIGLVMSPRQLFRELYRYLFHNPQEFYRLDRHFRILGLSTVSWLFLNMAFFGMGLDNPQGISTAWGITAPDSTLNVDRPRYYLRAADGKALLQSWIVVLQFLTGPAILAYLVRVYLVRYFIRRGVLNLASFMALISLAVFGGILYPRQTPGQPEVKKASGDGLYVLIMYSLFQFAMSLAPSALQFAFVAEIIQTRYRAALLGTCSALAMLGAVGVRAVVTYVDVFKTRLSYLTFLSAAAMAGSIFIFAILVPDHYTRTEVRQTGKRRLATLPLEVATGEREAVTEFEMNTINFDQSRP